MKILHIVATPRDRESRTLKVSSAFLDAIKKRYADLKVDELNVFIEKIPELTVKRLDGKYVLLGGKDLTPELEKAWEGIIAHINRFLSADAYIVSSPMWNFGIPYELKHYIDVILQPKYLFRYTASGPEGLVKGKKMVVITSRGGDYSPASSFHAYDLQEPYLRAAFGFVGLTDMTFINAQPWMPWGRRFRTRKIKEGASACAKGGSRVLAYSVYSLVSHGGVIASPVGAKQSKRDFFVGKQFCAILLGMTRILLSARRYSLKSLTLLPADTIMVFTCL